MNMVSDVNALRVGSPIRYLLRAATGVFGVLLGLLAIALYFQWPIVADIWPWGDYNDELTNLSYYFLSSIAGAICAPVLWIAITDKLHAAAPGAMNLTLSLAGIGGYMFLGYLADPGKTRLLYSALVMAVGLIAIVMIYYFGRNMKGTDVRPLPRPVRISFIGFIVVLTIVGISLILKTPNVIPWHVSKDAMVVYGWIFLGAAVYFIFAVVKPSWENGAGQLLGFLVYDVILILPFIRHFSYVAPGQFLSLVIYTGVVIYSGLLAVYYLFWNGSTRMRWTATA